MNAKELEQWKSELKKQYEDWQTRMNEAEKKSHRLYMNGANEVPEGKEMLRQLYAEHDKCRRLMSRIKPYLRDKWYVSEYLYSDVHAYEVVEVKTRKLMLVRRLKATLTKEARKALRDSFVPGGFCGHFDNDLQEWTFESDETQPILDIRLHSDGKWYRPHTRTCPFCMETEPYERYDYNY